MLPGTPVAQLAIEDINMNITASTHTHWYRAIVLILAAVMAALLLAACAGGPGGPNKETQAVVAALQTLTAAPCATVLPTETPTPSATVTPTSTSTPTQTPTPTPIIVGPTGFPEDVNPLTGLVVDNPALLDRRPLMIKVANFPRDGRPHNGLSAADLVFEYYIGTGTNRFMGVYYGQDAPKVGPIRSGRLVDAQLVPMYQGILGYSGAFWQVNNAIFAALGSRAIQSSPSNCPAICDDGRGLVYTVFAKTSELTKLSTTLGIDNSRPNLDGMHFDSRPPSGNQPGDQLTIMFNIQNVGEWRFDADSGLYKRWIEDADAAGNLSMIELVDANTEEQLAFSNVIVLFATYQEFAPTLHDVILKGNTTGMRAVLFRDGQAIEATWKAVGWDKPIQFFTADGQPLPLKPGNSWIAIMGNSSYMQQPEPGKWHVQYYLP